MRSPNLIWAFSRRDAGNMSLSYGDTKNSLESRRYFLEPLGISYRDLVCAKQIHSANIRYVTEENKGSGAFNYESSVADTDAFITDKFNLPLAIFTADCLSVFLYDPQRPAVGLVHAGWRSTKENITAKTIQLMRKNFSTKPENLLFGFGPSIGNCCYEVGNDFIDFFPGKLINNSGRLYLDLAGINKEQILQSGVKAENIFTQGSCTFCQNENFFSFRREGSTCGRLMSVIMLKK